MPINLSAPELKELRPRITVLGVGGAGGNAVNNMIAARLEGVEFVIANTDAQAIAQSKAERRIQLGAKTTEGLGAGAQPDVGRAGAEESLDEILEQLSGSHMVFITAGMGGGTGTGAAPVIARAVREAGMLVVGVVTKPFAFEGDKRMRIAERGILELQQYVHTLIVIPNQNLFRVANDRTTFAQAFAMADDVLHAGVRGVTDLIVMPGLINLDFADIKSVISEMGKAMMGTGESEGEDRALRAADMAISNPLLDDVSMKGARGVLINITGGPDLMLFEVEQAANRIRAEVDPDANIIFGNTILDDMEGRIRVSVVATGIDVVEQKLPEKVQPMRSNLKTPVGRAEIRDSRFEPKPEPRPDVREVRQEIKDVRQEPRSPAPSNPVHRQHEAIAEELGLPAPAMRSQQPEPQAVDTEDDDSRSLEEKYPVTVTVRPIRRPDIGNAPLHGPFPEPQKRLFGFLGRKKEDVRVEPPVSGRTTPPQRASAQVVARPPSEMRSPQAPAETGAEDLFPEQREDQYEIPAFLRRQSS
ncbi:MAG: cell division protein FtsZ [Alphaproteobacteria bacterium]|nr:cell division protein FtsZ [Alphaproteobacteria bacterium]